MSKLTTFAIVIALTRIAYAEDPPTQPQLAEQFNDEGKELMLASKYPEAAAKFRQAIARDSEAKYFMNLCTALLSDGKLDEALSTCHSAEINRPSDVQRDKIAKLIEKIKADAKAANVELHDTGGGGCCDKPDGTPDPTRTTNNPPPPNYTPTVIAPTQQNLVVAEPPGNRYTWTLGFDLFGGGGRIGRPDYYGTAFGGGRVKADVLINPPLRIGLEGYLQITHLGQGANDSAFVSSLDVFDIGVAGYKHFCPGGTPRFCVTPLLGVHLSLMSPAGEMDDTGSQVFNYAGVGGRGEVSMDFAFGRRYEHVLSVMVGANVYSKSLTGPSADSGNLTIAEAGLDQGGATGYLGLGYTYRFNTPLGAVPFVVLE
jgi:hypothetical protein